MEKCMSIFTMPLVKDHQNRRSGEMTLYVMKIYIF